MKCVYALLCCCWNKSESYSKRQCNSRLEKERLECSMFKRILKWSVCVHIMREHLNNILIQSDECNKKGNCFLFLVLTMTWFQCVLFLYALTQLVSVKTLVKKIYWIICQYQLLYNLRLKTQCRGGSAYHGLSQVKRTAGSSFKSMKSWK